MFIVIEGGDASGKTTVINNLKKDIELGLLPIEKDNSIIFKSPSAPFSDLWRIIDADKSIDPITRFYFFRTVAQNDSNKVGVNIKNGKDVILERYLYSIEAFNKAYDDFKGIKDEDLRSQTHLTYKGIIKPNLTIILDVPNEIRNERILSRKKQGDKISWWEESAFQGNLNKNLREIGKRENCFFVNTFENSPKMVRNIVNDKIEDIFKRQKFLKSDNENQLTREL